MGVSQSVTQIRRWDCAIDRAASPPDPSGVMAKHTRTHSLLLALVCLLLLGGATCDLFPLGDGPAGVPLPGTGGVRLFLDNQSGLPVEVEATFFSINSVVRSTTRTLAPSGPEATEEVIWTQTDIITAVARSLTEAQGDVAAQVRPGDILAQAQFQFGVDFENRNERVVFVIPPVGPEPLPNDCNGNGVLDAVDVAEGTSEDCNENGVPDECEFDVDGDGVIDACDGCPTDPEKTVPGVCGCGKTEVDSDGDGVPDCFDICPGGDDTIDSDDDGVPDDCDACPFDDPDDSDQDGVCDSDDNCPAVPNSDQADCDGDGVGDACTPANCDGDPACDDCNGNGQADGCDIFQQISDDCDGNGVPDECEAMLVASDQCVDAPSICPGFTYIGTNIGADTDGQEVSCTRGVSSHDVWYRYTPVEDGTVDISLMGSDFDTVLSVHSGCPGNSSNMIACNDDAFDGFLFSEITELAVQAETPYLIRIASFNSDQGTYVLNLSGPACSVAVPQMHTPSVAVGAPLNAPADDLAPHVTGDGLTVLFSTSRSGGLGGLDLFQGGRPDVDSAFTVQPLANVNSADHDTSPSLTGDGITLYFESNRTLQLPAGDGPQQIPPRTIVDAIGNPPPGDTSGNMPEIDIWVATRASASDPFDSPFALGAPINESGAEDGDPFILPDNLTLYFSSDRSGGQGGRDLWKATRSSATAPFDPPENLGGAINSDWNERHPTVSPDGLRLLFASDRPGGFGGYDLYVATRASASEPFGAAVNLGPAVNSAVDDVSPFVGSDNGSLWFATDRSGGPGMLDIWRSSWLDCNSDGIPDACQLGNNDFNGNGIPDDCEPPAAQ